MESYILREAIPVTTELKRQGEDVETTPLLIIHRLR